MERQELLNLCRQVTMMGSTPDNYDIAVNWFEKLLDKEISTLKDKLHRRNMLVNNKNKQIKELKNTVVDFDRQLLKINSITNVSNPTLETAIELLKEICQATSGINR